MRKILVALTLFTIFCPIANGQTRYKLTINADAFFDLRNDDTIHEHTTQAVSTDGTKSFEVRWASYNVTADSYWNMYFKSGGGQNGARIFNITNLGKILRVSYGSTALYEYYGNQEDPYDGNNISIGDNVWGFFSIRNQSPSSNVTVTNAFNITFEIDDAPPTIELDENSSENSTIISSKLGKTVNVSLYRSLKDGMWNAICLPFNLSSDQKSLLFGEEGYSLQQFSGVGSENGGTQLNFQAVAAEDELVAGIPYIVYPSRSIETNEKVTIEGVTIAETSEPETVTKYDNNNDAYTYQGIYTPTRLDNIAGDPKQVLFIGANNKFYWPKTSNPMKAFRAYFILPSNGTSSNFSLSTEEQGVSDGISLCEVTGLDIQGSPSSIYTIHGQLVGSFPDQLPKGIYITNGHKFIVK